MSDDPKTTSDAEREKRIKQLDAEIDEFEAQIAALQQTVGELKEDKKKPRKAEGPGFEEQHLFAEQF
jgi:predicted  nucleic acid-binding Zn-ribbon protein